MREALVARLSNRKANGALRDYATQLISRLLAWPAKAGLFGMRLAPAQPARSAPAFIRDSRPGSTAEATSPPVPTADDVVQTTQAIGLIFLAIVLFGADRADLSLALGAFWGAALVLAVRRKDFPIHLLRLRTLRIAGLLFGVMMVYLAASLLPVFPAAPLPFWPWVNDHAGTLDRSATAVELVRLLVLAATFTIGLTLGGTDTRARLAMRWICIAAAAYAGLSLVQHVLAPDRVLWATKGSFGSRLTGTFFSANVAAGCFGVFSILLLTRFESRPSTVARRTRDDMEFLAKCVATAATLACLVLTASRMGAIALIASLLTLLVLSIVLRRNDSRPNSSWPMSIAYLAFFTSLVIPGSFLIKRLGATDEGWGGRHELFSAHWDAFTASPATGYGLGSFPSINRISTTADNFGALWYVRATHNVYLQWLEETGIIGAALMFSIVGLLLFAILRGLVRRRSMHWLLRGVLGASLFLAVQGLADFSLQTPAISILWSVLLGLGFSVATGGYNATRAAARTATDADRKMALWIPLGLAITVELMSLMSLWANAGIAASQRFPFVLKSGYESHILDAMTGPQSPAVGREVRRSVGAALRQAPADPYLWVLAASVDGVGEAGLDALARSYDCAPFDPTLVRWRTEFAARQWTNVPAGLRSKILNEVAVERDWGLRPWIQDMATAYRGQPFGLALALAITTADNANRPPATQTVQTQ